MLHSFHYFNENLQAVLISIGNLQSSLNCNGKLIVFHLKWKYRNNEIYYDWINCNNYTLHLSWLLKTFELFHIKCFSYKKNSEEFSIDKWEANENIIFSQLLWYISYLMKYRCFTIAFVMFAFVNTFRNRKENEIESTGVKVGYNEKNCILLWMAYVREPTTYGEWKFSQFSSRFSYFSHKNNFKHHLPIRKACQCILRLRLHYRLDGRDEIKYLAVVEITHTPTW